MKQNETNILLDIKEDIGYIKGEVSGIRGEMKKINGSIQNHEKRINTNESELDTLLGKISVVGSIGVFLGGVLMWILNYFTK